ncbi:MAG: hypothetical protein AB7V21_00755 [Phycisphaerales bacterium]
MSGADCLGRVNVGRAWSGTSHRPGRRRLVAPGACAACLLAVCAIVAVPRVAIAQDAATGDLGTLPAVEIHGPRNAALVYWRLWQKVPEDLKIGLTQSFNGRDLDWAPDASLAEQLDTNRALADALRVASQMPVCDFGVDQTAGLGADMSHLERLRESSRILVSSARLCLNRGDMDTFVASTRSLLTMSHHTTADGFTQSCTVGLGFAVMGADEILRAIRHVRLTEAHVKAFDEDLRRAMENDAYGFVNAIRVEGRVLSKHLVDRYAGPTDENGRTAGARLFMDIQQGGEPEGLYKAITEMDGPGLTAAAERIVAAFDAVALAWRSESPLESVRAVEERVAKGEFGPLGLMVVPRYSSIREFVDSCRVKIGEAVEAMKHPPAELVAIPVPKVEPMGPALGPSGDGVKGE